MHILKKNCNPKWLIQFNPVVLQFLPYIQIECTCMPKISSSGHSWLFGQKKTNLLCTRKISNSLYPIPHKHTYYIFFLKIWIFGTKNVWYEIYHPRCATLKDLFNAKSKVERKADELLTSWRNWLPTKCILKLKHSYRALIWKFLNYW